MNFIIDNLNILQDEEFKLQKQIEFLFFILLAIQSLSTKNETIENLNSNRAFIDQIAEADPLLLVLRSKLFHILCAEGNLFNYR